MNKIVLIIREPYTSKRAVVLLDHWPYMKECFKISQNILTHCGEKFSNDRDELTFETDYLQKLEDQNEIK